MATVTEPAADRPAPPRRRRAAAGDHRRLPPRHRGAEAERHRHHLRPAGHPDHRPHAHAAGRGPARDLVPPRAERGLRRLDRGLPHAEAGHLPHGLGAGLPERPHRARARDHQLLPDDPHHRLVGARDRRPAAGRLRGDGPARDRQAASPRRPSACCMPRTSASASRARSAPRSRAAPAACTSTCPRSSSRSRSTPRPAASSLIKVVDPAPKQIPAPDAVKRAVDLLKGAKKPLIVLGKGAAYAQADADIQALVEKTGIPYICRCRWPRACCPIRTTQCAARRALLRAAGSGRGDAHRRAPELAALARQGQDLGRQGPQGLGRAEVRPGGHLAASRPTAT